MALPVVLLALGIALCPSHHFAFFHVPKGGGMSIYSLLRKHFPHECLIYGGILDEKEAVEWLSAGTKSSQRLQVDPMHVTPLQLDEFVHRSELRLKSRERTDHISDIQRFGDGDVDTGASRENISVADVLMSWHSAAIVRSPYLRVLSAYDQRQGGVYAKFWGDAPQPFDAYMRWLDQGLRSRHLAWCCSPTITHFLPSTRFTHWPDGSAAIRSVFKTEEMLAAQLGIMQLLGGGDATAQRLNQSEHTNLKPASSKRAALCQHAYGCDASELGALLNTTAHTVETLRIVERLYQRDFDLLGYRRFDL